MSSKRGMLKNSGIYGLVQILQKGIGLVMMPIYTRILDPYDTGVANNVSAIVSFFVVFYTLCLNSAVMRFYVEYKDQKEELKQFWGTCVTFVLLNSVVMSAFLFLTRDYILSPLLGGKIEFFPYIFVGLITITLSPIYQMYQSSLQAKEESKSYGVNNIVYFSVNLFFNILFIVIIRMGAIGILLALAVTEGIFFVYTIIKFLPKLTLKIKKSYLIEALRYSLPLLPHTLSGWATAMIDKLFLNAFKGAASSGIYSTAAQFSTVINVLTTAVNQAYVPWFFAKMKDKEKNEKDIVKMAEYLMIAYCFLAMGMSLFGPEVIKIAGTKYREGWVVIPFMSFAYVFNGMYYFFVNPLFYNKKGVKFIAIGTFTGAILNCILNYVLIPYFGTIGAGLASLLSSIVSCVLIYFIASKIEKIQFKTLKMFATVFFFFGISLISFPLAKYNLIINLFIKSIIVIIILGIVLYGHRIEVVQLINEKIRKQDQ